MASQTIKGGATFPEGTTVGAYPATQVPPEGGPPTGSAVATATVTGGDLAFSGLADGTAYVAYAASPDRYKRFSTPSLSAGSGGGRVFDIRDFTAAGNPGTGNIVADMAAFEAVGSAANAVGGGVVWVPPTISNYQVKRRVPGDNNSGSITMYPNVFWRGAGTKLIEKENVQVFKGDSGMGTAATITADTVPADLTFTVDATAQFTVGGWVFVRLGTAAYDAAEPDWWFNAKVTAIPDSTHVTLDCPADYTMTVASTSAANRQIRPINTWMENFGIEGFDIIGDIAAGGHIEMGIDIRHARNGYINNVTGEHCGAGIVVTQFVDNLVIPNIAIRSCDDQGAASQGRGLAFGESRNVFVGAADLRDCEGTFVIAEGRCENVKISSLKAQNTFPGRSNSSSGQPLITTLGNSDVQIDNLHLIGNTLQIQGTGGTSGNSLRIASAKLYTPTDPSIDRLDIFTGPLRVRGLNYGPPRTYSRTFPLGPSISNQIISLPRGLIRTARIYASGLTGLTNLYMHDGITQYSDLSSQLVAGQTVNIGNLAETSLTSWNAREGKQLRLTTGASASAADYITIKVDYFPAAGGGDTLQDSARSDVAPVIGLDQATADSRYAPQYPPAVAAPSNSIEVVTSGTVSAGSMLACRVVIPRTGTLNSLWLPVNTASGNVKGVIYDVGATTSAVRTLLWAGSSVAAVAGWLNLGAPNLSVVAGQHLDLAIVTDNATVANGRRSLILSSLSLFPPSATNVAGCNFKLSWNLATTFATPSTTVSEAQAAVTAIVPVLAGVVI